ncbi:hypothetical protein B0H21DRAFT_826501 [Amylocystis lapponica]|nr:hypothetical protein B0H21DRAFT_826501 [Amylocystis lapponica]
MLDASAITTCSSHPIPFDLRAAAPSHCTNCGSTLDLLRAQQYWMRAVQPRARPQCTCPRVGLVDDGDYLIQNKADSKLVELPSAAISRADPDDVEGLEPSVANALATEKVEAVGIEYLFMLMSLQPDLQWTIVQTGELHTQVRELH